MLDKNSGGTGDESPLYTPEQEDSKGKPADIIQRMNQAIAQAPKTEDPENDAKKKGWQERLAKLKTKKQEEKKQEQIRRQSTIKDAEVEKVREEFGLAKGLRASETATGEKTLTVNHSETDSRLDGEEILQQEQKKQASVLKPISSAGSELSTPTHIGGGGRLGQGSQS